MVFVFDLDGTLLDDRERLSERNREAVLKVAKDHVVILASGRMLKSILNFSKEEFGREFPTIAYNGAMVYVPGEGIVYENGIEPDVAVSVIEDLRERKVHRQAYVNDELLSEEDNEEVRSYAEHSGVRYKVVPDLVEVVSKHGSTKILSIADPEVLDEIKKELTPEYPQLRIFKSFPNYLDFVPKSVGKAKALEFLAEKMGFSLKEVIAFGDNDNDADMIREVGIGVAMGNATKSVLEVADIVAPSNNEDGVAEIVDRVLSGLIDLNSRLENP